MAEQTRIRVIAPDGTPGSIPADQLEEAVKAGYTAAPEPVAAPAAPQTPAGAASAPPQAASPEGDGLVASAVKAAPQVISDVATGALKGVGGMVAGAGEMVHKIPGVSAAVDALYGTPGLSDNAFKAAQQATAPANTAQAIGHGAANIAGLMIAPEEVGAGMAAPILAKAGAAGLMTGTQTGGDPTAMALGAGGSAAGDIAAKGAGSLAKIVRSGEAEPVAAKRTAELARQGLKGTARTNAVNDPMWMAAQETNKAKYVDLMKQYRLTGSPLKDAAIIAQAPPQQQEVLSALSRQLNPATKQFGHEWTAAQALAGLGSVAGGGMAAGPVGASSVGGMLLARSLMTKYPGATANGLDTVGQALPALARQAGGAIGRMAAAPSPMEQELLRRNGGQ